MLPTYIVHVHGVPDEMFSCLLGTVVDSCLLLERKRGLLQFYRGLESLTVDWRVLPWTGESYCGLESLTVDWRVLQWTGESYRGLESLTVDWRVLPWTGESYEKKIMVLNLWNNTYLHERIVPD